MLHMVIWRATRNTERSALSRFPHWAEHFLLDTVPSKNASMLIVPVVDGCARSDLDMRWIEKTQILSSKVVDDVT